MYHIGLVKGTGKTKLWGNNHRESTVVLQARKSVDFLSPYTWQYIGQREITKKQLHENKHTILTWINGYFHTNFKTIIID